MLDQNNDVPKATDATGFFGSLGRIRILYTQGNPGSKRDIKLGALLLIISILVLVESRNIPDAVAVFETVGSAPFPRAVSIIVGLLSLVVLIGGIRDLVRLPNVVPEKPAHTRKPFLAVMIFVITCAYVASMHIGLLGFRLSTILFFIIVGLFSVGLHPKRLMLIFAISLILSLGCHYFFTHVFIIDLP